MFQAPPYQGKVNLDNVQIACHVADTVPTPGFCLIGDERAACWLVTHRFHHETNVGYAYCTYPESGPDVPAQTPKLGVRTGLEARGVSGRHCLSHISF